MGPRRPAFLLSIVYAEGFLTTLYGIKILLEFGGKSFRNKQ
jgi:hypothetical protein